MSEANILIPSAPAKKIMCEEHIFQKNREPWRPTAEFFLSNPRSAAIRGVCIDIIQKLEGLMNNPDVVENRDRKQTLYAELEMLGGKLIEMGIRPELNAGLPLEEYQSSPVKTAEWIAGQLYPTTGHSVISEKEISPIIQEFDIINLKGARLMETKNMPDKMRQFFVERQVVSFIGSLLDIPESLHPQKP